MPNRGKEMQKLKTALEMLLFFYQVNVCIILNSYSEFQKAKIIKYEMLFSTTGGIELITSMET